jgi:lipopolysaccharide export system protein LptA
MSRAFLFGWALLFVCTSVKAQTKIRILSSDITDIVKQKDGSRIYYLRGNVGLQQDVAVMTCDSAILIQPQNEFQAFKNVKIVQADTTIITGNQLDYNGERRTFTISENVELKTPSSMLKTKQLYYDRKSATAYYTTRSTLTRNSLELTSDRGSYNTDYETVWLRGKVEAIDSAYTLFTDTLLYYPNFDRYEFAGPSTLLRDSTTILCSLGVYEAESAQLNLGKGAAISSPGSYIASDSISYNLKTDAGKLFGNALVADTSQGLVLESEFIDYLKKPNFVDAYFPVYYRQRMDQDTLYARGDTLHIRSDSSGFRTVDLRHNTVFYSEDFQGKSAFFSYKEDSEQLTLYPTPKMWSNQSQFTCDSAILTLKEENLDSLFLINNTTITSLTEDSVHYDQATGKELEGQFKNNNIHALLLKGNAQNITHSINDDGVVEGVNKSACAFISISFKDGDAKKVNASKGVEASYAPWDIATQEMKSLPGCTPLFEQRISKEQTRPIVQ